MLTDGAALGAATGHLLVRLIPALRSRPATLGGGPFRKPHQFLLVVPAHDEGRIIPCTFPVIQTASRAPSGGA